MQALIGLSEDPGFWTSETQYAKYQPYAAVRCGQPQTRELPAGEYEVWVGWAGQFERSNYTRNGHISPLTLAPGQRLARTFSPEDMTLDFVCISCPFVSVRQGGAMVELGQILIDRYSPRREGTDSRTVAAQVVDGKVRVVLSEREDEVSFIDAVRVFAAGSELALDAAVPSALRSIDGARHRMTRGDSIALDFAAPVDSGSLTVTIQVSGHYRLNHIK
jgi:hypothetical protein